MVIGTVPFETGACEEKSGICCSVSANVKLSLRKSPIDVGV